MTTVTKTALLAVCTALGVLATAASAAPIVVNSSGTISSDATGDDGATGLDDAIGFPGGYAVLWNNTDVDVTILSGYTFTGGLGGLGGPDAANNGGNAGNQGGAGFLMPDSGGTVTATGIFVYGGTGGNGSAGSTGGANDTAGGNGGTGGYGINGINDGLQFHLTNTNVYGATGGIGAAAGDAGGDAGNNTQGGAGGYGGIGIFAQGIGNIIDISGSSVISGGNGGAGGTSLANATNATGGGGGEGIYDAGTNTVVTIGAGAIVQGGDGGAAGTGGTGGSGGFGGSGVWLQGTGASLTNYGTILGESRSAVEIVAGSGTLIENYGTIGAPVGHSGRGVLVNSGSVQLLHNHVGGVIQSTGFQAFRIANSAYLVNFVNEGLIIGSGSGEAVDISNSTIVNFTNSGTIQATNATALFLNPFGQGSIPDLILNTGGLITSDAWGYGAVTITSDLGAAGITFEGGQITNTGGYAAIDVLGAQTGDINIVNATIEGGVFFNEAGETLNLTGVTFNGGNIEFETGGGNTLNFLGGTTTFTTTGADTRFVNTTLFSVFDGATVISNTEQTEANSSINDLFMATNSTLTLNESFWVDNEAVNLGAVFIAAGKTLTGNAVVGDGVFQFGVTDATTVGKIEALGVGGAIDVTGATFEIVLDNPSDSFVAGTNFLLAEDLNDNDIIGVTNGTVLLDNSALLTFILYRGDAAEIGLTSDLLFAQIGQLLLADIAGEGDDPNSIALGAALDTIGLDGNDDLDDLMLALALLPTNQDINEILDALLPETDGVAYDIATDAGDRMLDVASRRLDGLRGTTNAGLEYRVASLNLLGLRGAADTRARNQFWGQAFGRRVDQGKHSFNDGYDAGSYGFAVGADTALSNSTQLGAALSYTSTNADGNGVNRTDTDVESYQLTLYGDHLFENAMYAKGLLAFARHNNDIARHDIGGIPGNTATGGYDATAFNLRAELGRVYAGGGNLNLIPRATLSAAWYSPDGYSEQGVGGLGLTVTPDDLASARLGFGVLARWNVNLSGGELFQPELRLDYRRDLTQERFETTSEFLGAPGIAFRTQGVEPAADILNLGVGALLATAGGVNVRASYDFELKEDYTAHAGYVRASVAF